MSYGIHSLECKYCHGTGTLTEEWTDALEYCANCIHGEAALAAAQAAEDAAMIEAAEVKS